MKNVVESVGGTTEDPQNPRIRVQNHPKKAQIRQNLYRIMHKNVRNPLPILTESSKKKTEKCGTHRIASSDVEDYLD